MKLLRTKETLSNMYNENVLDKEREEEKRERERERERERAAA